MPKKRVFISCRIDEMRTFREAAVRAINAAGMDPAFFDSTHPEKRWPLKPGISQIDQLLEAVRTSDAFLGLYGQTLNTNWMPPGYDKHSIELEYEEADSNKLPSFLYVARSGATLDEHMTRFRSCVMRKVVEFLSTPDELYQDLLTKLEALKPRIFVSYSSKDQTFVDAMFDRLKSSGHYSWLNTESIPKGEQWLEEMRRGLQETDLLILVVSPDSMKSKWVKEEWKTFLKAGKKVLPVLFRESKVPKILGKIEMIKADHHGWYSKLLKTVEQNLKSLGSKVA